MPLNASKCVHVTIKSVPTNNLTLTSHDPTVAVLMITSSKILGVDVNDAFTPFPYYKKVRAVLLLICRSLVKLPPRTFLPL